MTTGRARTGQRLPGGGTPGAADPGLRGVAVASRVRADIATGRLPADVDADGQAAFYARRYGPP
ncbi:hypothetical protein GCM10023336_36440 [Streptomyces similanensis]|uniref:Uncharacterized protein n=1 Tax=Streptomyces similanensis TaxID=1274988 RepID=A0ABP9KMJ2_9ACTN